MLIRVYPLLRYGVGRMDEGLLDVTRSVSIASFSPVKSALKELRATSLLALPMIIGQVATHLVHVIDLAMVGRVGVDSLAAATFATSFFGMFWLFTIGMVVAVSITISEAYGSEDIARVKEVLRNGLLVCGILSLLFAAILTLMVLFTDLWHLWQPQPVIDHAGPYLIYLAVSILPLLVFHCFKAYAEATGQPWAPLWFLGLALVANVFLNWIFIYGNLGSPAMGLNGAGLATVLARFIALIAFWWWLAGQPHGHVRWNPREFFRPVWNEKWEIFKLGAPVGLQICFEVVAFNLAAFFMGWMAQGEVALAAHSIAINFAALAFMVPLGLSFAVAIRVGQARGRGDWVQARMVGLSSVIGAAGFMGIVALVFVVGRKWLPLLVLDPGVGELAPQVIALASTLLLYAAAFAVSDGVQANLSSALRGYRDVRAPAIISFSTYWLVGLPIAFILGYSLDGSDNLPPAILKVCQWLRIRGFGLQAPGVWTGLCIGLIVISIALGFRFVKVSRIKG